MASTMNLGGLRHFINTLDRYAILLQNFYKAMEMICQEAQKYAQNEYSRYGRTDITVDYDNNGTAATISANGEQVAFYEFGTGRVGAGTYLGRLPSSGVPITGSWYYFYPSTSKIVTSKGQEGWWYDNTFQKGIDAEAEMWKTSQFIMQQAHFIIQTYFKTQGGAV